MLRFLAARKDLSELYFSRALNEDDALVKIEYNGKKIYMLNAIPVTVAGSRAILELMKDITDSGIIDLDVSSTDVDKVRKIINRRNEAAVSDELTGVYNRRYIYERLPFDILKSVADKTPLTVFMTDLDEFKKINDCYGHVGGDYAVRGFAKVLKSCVRKDRDWVARYGGDEFLVVLGSTDSEDAFPVVERMRQKVQRSKIVYEDQIVKITASFGGCVLMGEGMAVEKLVACADKQLYRSQAGRP